MEKQFKHRKTGEIAYYKDGVFKQGRFAVEIGHEPSKEYWEEIIEKPTKEWEILELITNTFVGVTKSKVDIEAFENKAKDTEKWKIKSVKRLSDGQVFSLRDYVTERETRINLKWHITKFYIHSTHGGLMADGINLIYLKKFNPVLFTTEDGVEIRKGDEIYFVTSWLEYQGKYIGSENTMKLFPGRKIFSTEQSAKDYILKNKPVLSYNDVIELGEKDIPIGYNLYTIHTDDLLKLVKSKI